MWHEHMRQALLTEKDEELCALRERVERLEARRGALNQLKALDAKTAQLKVRLTFGAALDGQATQCNGDVKGCKLFVHETTFGPKALCDICLPGCCSW
jgi:hypothetical protein